MAHNIYTTEFGPGFAAGVFDGTPDSGRLLRQFIAPSREAAIQQARQWVIKADGHRFIPGDLIRSTIDGFWTAVVITYCPMINGKLPGYLVETPSGKQDWISEDMAVLIAAALDEGDSSPARPALRCNCGGTAAFVGMQVIKALGVQQAVHNCSACDTSVTGPRESLDGKAVQR